MIQFERMKQAGLIDKYVTVGPSDSISGVNVWVNGKHKFYYAHDFNKVEKDISN